MQTNENSLPESYPLRWPVGWKRNAGMRKRAAFKVTLTSALDRLEKQLGLMGVRRADIVVSSDLRARLDGRPYADQAAPKDPGIAVYFRWRNKAHVLACDRWDRVDGNIAAIAAHVEAMRGQERWGVGSLEQAFAGYAALAAGPTSGADWRGVFENDLAAAFQEDRRWRSTTLRTTETDLVRLRVLEVVEDAHTKRMRRAHPDAGGSHDEAARLTEALLAARKELG